MNSARCDDWKGREDEGVELCDPTWEQLEELILSLNGQNKTLVTFDNEDEEWYMAVGGGPSQYILYLSFEDEERIVELVDPTQPEDSYVKLTVGGQWGEYPQNTCVSQEKVLMAAKTFYETQTPDERLSWKE